jgi:hypothetical protein
MSERREEGSTTFGLMELEVQSVGLVRIKLPIYPPEGKSPVHLSATLFWIQRPMGIVTLDPESVNISEYWHQLQVAGVLRQLHRERPVQG